jgi:tetratricopeptide (TPR) repeat protein
MAEDNSINAKLNDLGRLWNATDPQVSEAAYRALLPEAEALAPHDRCSLIDVHTAIARCEMLQNKFAPARASLAEAERLLNEQDAAYRVSSRIRWCIETGRLQVLEKTPSQARARFAEAWSLALNSGEDALAVEIALLIAPVEPQKQQPEWIARGIRLAEESPQPGAKRWLGNLYSASGWKLFEVRQFEAALGAFQKALSHLKSHGTEREVFVAKWSIGKLLRTMGRAEEALAIQNALLADLGVGKQKDGRLFEELAECLHSLKRVPEAQVYFDLAYHELFQDEWVKNNQPAVLKRLKDLGKSK